MYARMTPLAVVTAVVLFAGTPSLRAQSPERQESDIGRLIAAMLGDTPLVRDLMSLTQEIGGRATGSPANREAVFWAVERFREAGLPVAREAFTMPSLWLERSASGVVRGEGVSFPARMAAMPFSTATPRGGVTAPLVSVGSGSEDEFARVGAGARGAFLLVATSELLDIEGLFLEYSDAYAIERRAVSAGARGVIYMGSRAEGILHRHNSSLLGGLARPMAIMDRGPATRALALLNAGRSLTLTLDLDLETGSSYESHNVIGEIRGATRPDEIVVVGAHLDSWDLGGGALDNGANVALVIDVARQMRRLGIRPARTIRFALWNGEEQGLRGSAGYAQTHEDELDRHVMAMSFDIGCGLINGFFTGGRPEVLAGLEHRLAPVRGLGPFTNIDVPIVGTDNFDFMMHGVANLVGNQEPATYGPNYHASSDQFEECDVRTLRLNAAIVAAVTYGFATGEVSWRRQSRAEIERLIAETDLEEQMRTFSVWAEWEDGSRGRQRDR
ncbi:MAG: M28 family peptidase [Longimicrobiales bacterium]